MIKVMHVLNTGGYSGAENVVITLINALKEKVDSTYVSPEGYIKEYLDENEIEYKSVRKLTVAEIKRVIMNVQPDIIHAHGFTAGIICSLATTRPLISHIHSNPPWIKHLNIRSFAYMISCRKYKKILTVSEAVMDEYVFGKRLKKKTEVVGNPIDLNKIKTSAGAMDIQYDIAFLGRFIPLKNLHMFLDIIEKVKLSLPNIRVIMIGDGELREEIEKRIVTEGLSNNITLVGFQKNPYKYLNKAKILLMPSAWEGYGLAAVEALALGKPVVCSNVGGLPQIINNNCGMVCEKIEEYCDAVVKMINNSDYYELLSKNAFERSTYYNNINEYANKINELYTKLSFSQKLGDRH